MTEKTYDTTRLVFLIFILTTLLCRCGSHSGLAETVAPISNCVVLSTTETDNSSVSEIRTAETLSDEQALSAIRDYCCKMNPDLESIVNDGEYTVYWEVSASDEHEIVILFRSYTGTQNRYYIDRATGDTYVTEYVPGVTLEEQRTDESFNINRLVEDGVPKETEEFRSAFFNVTDEEPFFIHCKDGKHYGFEMDFWGGCSVWCSVTDYQITAKASSTLTAQGSYSYEASNILNADRSNAWIEGADSYGIGEYIDISHCYYVSDAEYGVDFRELCVVNGYAQTLEKWIANSRVKDLKLFFDGEYIDTIHLEDTIEPQYFDLKQYNLHADSGAESIFRFEIASVYQGEEYADTAITGIEIDFWTPNL